MVGLVRITKLRSMVDIVNELLGEQRVMRQECKQNLYNDLRKTHLVLGVQHIDVDE